MLHTKRFTVRRSSFVLVCACVLGASMPCLAEEISTQAVAKTKKVIEARAQVNPTQGNQVRGSVLFTAVKGGVKILADFEGLTPGKHGFHIHEHGDCSAADASSAGGHFNPTNTMHGGPDTLIRHVGDLGNLEANAQGHAHYERTDTLISLNGDFSIVGKSVVVHALEDDLKSQPTGGSGARVACGMIEALADQ